MIFVDYILVITWFPAVLVWYHNHYERNYPCNPIPSKKPTSTEHARNLLSKGGEKPNRRSLEVFFGDTFAIYCETKV